MGEGRMEKRSALTTLCYMEKDGCYLMMHRVRKKQDVNAGKWIGVGGHFEENESPEECLVREVREETGLRLETWRFRGIVTFMAKGWPTEYMCLFTADAPEGEVLDCEEGELCWIPKGEIMNLNLWEGDRIFLRFLLEEHGFFSLKLEYDGDRLERAVLDGKELEVTGQTKERDVLEVGDER
jgi:8-oxo-dGTP diphosphatase